MNTPFNNQKGFTRQKKQTLFSGGFTLIETVVAIFILSLTIGALLTLAAGGIFSVRYARNQIVAENLMQETLEYFHNYRDSSAQDTANPLPWDQWILTLGNPTGSQSSEKKCFSDDGCVVDQYTSPARIRWCSYSTPNRCQYISYYPDYGFYGYDGPYPFGTSQSITTTYARKVTTQLLDPNQLLVTVEVTWMNGLNPKTVRQSTILTNWRI